MDDLIYDFGILPDYVGLGNARPTPVQLEVGVRFQLELWRVGEAYQLRYAHKIREWPATKPLDYFRVCFMQPARGPGFSVVVLKSTALKPQTTLLNARYDDLEWMRETARTLGGLLGAPVEENDWGSDD